MKNAFIADYLADTLEAEGFTSGYLSSYDGFTRNLDRRRNEYAFNLFDRQGSDVNLPAKMRYTAPLSIVFLRDYPMGEQDKWHYYAFRENRHDVPGHRRRPEQERLSQPGFLLRKPWLRGDSDADSAGVHRRRA